MHTYLPKYTYIYVHFWANAYIQVCTHAHKCTCTVICLWNYKEYKIHIIHNIHHPSGVSYNPITISLTSVDTYDSQKYLCENTTQVICQKNFLRSVQVIFASVHWLKPLNIFVQNSFDQKCQEMLDSENYFSYLSHYLCLLVCQESLIGKKLKAQEEMQSRLYKLAIE